MASPNTQPNPALHAPALTKRQYTPPKANSRSMVDQVIEDHNLKGTRQFLLNTVANNLLGLPIEEWFKVALKDQDVKFNHGSATTVMQGILNRRQNVLDKDSGWAFLDVEGKEDDIYAGFEGIDEQINAVTKDKGYLSKDSNPSYLSKSRTTFVKCLPNKAAISPVYINVWKPDCRAILTNAACLKGRSPRSVPTRKKFLENMHNEFGNSEELNDIYHCAAIFEFKKEKSSRAENEAQILGGAANIMYGDPARRFVYGVTMEGPWTRLWLFDRGIVLVSDEFDANKDPVHLIRILLYLAFAKKAHLGYDLTVTRKVEKGDPTDPEAKDETYFIYEAGEKHYRTIGSPLYERGAFELLSRGVRVWTVQESDKNGKFNTQGTDQHVLKEGTDQHVLKDFWPLKDTPTESTIMENIISELKTDSDQDALRGYFLTVLHDGNVPVPPETEPLSHDWTTMVPEEAKQIKFAAFKSKPSADPESHRTPLLGFAAPVGKNRSRSGLLEALKMDRKYPQREHRRIIFEEVCTSFEKETNASTALTAIADIAEGKSFFLCTPSNGPDRSFTALNLLRKAGYIHRDISPGNCLIYESHGKLSDLEFCKPFLAESKGDSFSGTTEFMAAEVLTKRLLFRPEKLEDDSESEEPGNIYHPHPIHDLEALNWMTWWFFLSKTLPSASASAPSSAAVDHWRSEIWRPLFAQEGATRTLRRTALYTPSWIKGYAYVFMECGWDKKLMRALTPVLNFARTIGQEHEAIQQQPQDTDGKGNIRWPAKVFRAEPYTEYTKVLKKAAASLGNLELASIWDHVDA
ncbi:hypothetical protein DFP72DRAFT_1108795 [Ephemerocybe angulata]|uniref:Fungal-type protein kinase domain-containing protein n=1 Tax=Ephemerocybe angulata TaxID=980116 RepID=A0A8H6IHK8_9AGAR|nr:hypothetical protein DFP72DRAFT_1108795 [Tulosesus angulatus]